MQNFASSFKKPKPVQQLATRLRDFLTKLTLEKIDLTEVKESTKDALRRDFCWDSQTLL